MSDLISRQALCEYALNQKDKSVTPNDIMRFPSAQSYLDEWCTDCKEYDSEKNCCPRFNMVIRGALKEGLAESTDAISRQAAIDALDEIEAEVADGYGYQYAKWREYFVEMPSAQPEMIREIRKWINSSNRGNADYFIVDKIEEIIKRYE